MAIWTASERLAAPVLPIAEDRWLRTVPGGEVDAAGDHGDGRAVGGGPEHLGLALGQRRVTDGEAVHGQRRVDDAQALVHPAYGVGELRRRACP